MLWEEQNMHSRLRENDAKGVPSLRCSLSVSDGRTRGDELLSDLFADQRFRIVTETMVDGLIVIDAVGSIRYVNPSCERLFGYDLGQLIDKNVKTLMPTPFAEAHDGYLARARETKVKRIIGIGRELQGKKSDGEVFPMYLSVGEANMGGEVLFIGIIYDLTDKKRAEEMLLHHQKLDAIGQLSGGIAHDFNNILAVISGNLEMLERHDLPPSARRAVNRAKEASVKAARITHRLLAFARRQPLSPEPIDLNRSLQDLSEILDQTLGPNIAISMHRADNLPAVEVDIDQFETAILNLAVNARDAMPDGGQLVIETDTLRVSDEPRTRDDTPPGDYVRVSVSDTGEGMPPEIVAKAVDPFFTTKQAGSGTGLGLSMVYGFMKQLGGHAKIYSEVGHGTRISLFFPAQDIALPAPDAAQDVTSYMGDGETVLVVDDRSDVLEVTADRLQQLGYDVLTAEDGMGALAAIEANPSVQVAVLDVVMPGGMDGHQLADQIEAIRPDVRIIMYSGYSPKLASGEAAHPNRPFLSKPVSMLKLAKVVRDVLGGGPSA